MDKDHVKSEDPVRYKTGRENSKWYVIPPIKKLDSWRIVKYINETQELVARFEDRKECEDTVKLHNDYL